MYDVICHVRVTGRWRFQVSLRLANDLHQGRHDGGRHARGRELRDRPRHRVLQQAGTIAEAPLVALKATNKMIIDSYFWEMAEGTSTFTGIPLPFVK